MKKRLAIVAVSLVAVLGMTSCAKEVTAEEANKQANSYSQDDASAKYTSGTLSTSTTITSDNKKIQAILTLADMESGKTYTTSATAPVTVITSATLTSFTASYESDNIKYYIDGSSVSVRVNYTGTNDDKDYGVTGTATVSAEFKTTGEGLASSSYVKLSYKDAYIGSTSIGSFSSEIKMSYTYNK